MPGVPNKFPNPSSFSQQVQALSYQLMTLNGRAGRNVATIVPAVTLDAGIVPDAGYIASFQMKAIDTGTTSSATFNTVALFRTPRGSITPTNIAICRTNRGSNGASTSATITGATLLVNPGDMLSIRRLTKLNGLSQLFCTVTVDKLVNPS